MNKSEEPEDQYINDLIYIGNMAKAFGLAEVLNLTIDQYNKRKEELEGQKPPWLN